MRVGFFVTVRNLDEFEGDSGEILPSTIFAGLSTSPRRGSISAAHQPTVWSSGQSNILLSEPIRQHLQMPAVPPHHPMIGARESDGCL